MKPAPFDHVAATSVLEAAQVLESAVFVGHEAKVLAGGQSLVPLMALRLARPAILVDVNRVAELHGVETGAAGTVRVGATTRHAELARQRAHPLLAEAARHIGHTAIRTRGTFGGSLAHADPAAELPLVASATAAVLELASARGARRVAAADFFESTFSTALAEDELLVAATVAVPTRWGFAEFARRHGDFALVAAVVAEVGGRFRVRVGGVAPVPWAATAAEDILAGAPAADARPLAEVAARDLAAAAGAAAGAEVDPGDDIHAPAAYRRALTAELVARAVRDALSRPPSRPEVAP
ncbi:MAG: FAD binding domain-containing protein [Acidimicrobiia bacterium]|nr:FAD binding domain-containing protein [Acidimicrobiia bacterium]